MKGSKCDRLKLSVYICLKRIKHPQVAGATVKFNEAPNNLSNVQCYLYKSLVTPIFLIKSLLGKRGGKFKYSITPIFLQN